MYWFTRNGIDYVMTIEDTMARPFLELQELDNHNSLFQVEMPIQEGYTRIVYNPNYDVIFILWSGKVYYLGFERDITMGRVSAPSLIKDINDNGSCVILDHNPLFILASIEVEENRLKATPIFGHFNDHRMHVYCFTNNRLVYRGERGVVFFDGNKLERKESTNIEEVINFCYRIQVSSLTCHNPRFRVSKNLDRITSESLVVDVSGDGTLLEKCIGETENIIIYPHRVEEKRIIYLDEEIRRLQSLVL